MASKSKKIKIKIHTALQGATISSKKAIIFIINNNSYARTIEQVGIGIIT